MDHHTPCPSRRHVLHHLAALACVPLAACSSTPSGTAVAAATMPAAVTPADAALLAPTGTLRASINLGNPILAARGAAPGTATGVSVDLASRLAELLGVPLELKVVDAAARSVAVVKAGEADIGFFAIDPLRADGITFTAAYVQIEGAYLVRNASPLRDNAEVDRAGTRIMVGKGSAYDLYLSRALQAATLMHTPTSPTVVDQFLVQGADVAAGVKQQLEADAARIGGLRLLPGRFMVIEQAMGLPSARGDAARAALRRYVEWAKASGFVAQALARHQIRGALVAPAG
jgi:polar amino acid transport system substrate-binding protein